MATVPVVGGVANITTAQSTNGVSQNVADRGSLGGGPAVLRIVTTIGATPTCTYLIEGSADGTNFFAAPYATAAAPETPVVATFAITTATTTLFHIRANHAWRYLRVTLSAITNVTSSIDLYAA